MSKGVSTLTIALIGILAFLIAIIIVLWYQSSLIISNLPACYQQKVQTGCSAEGEACAISQCCQNCGVSCQWNLNPINLFRTCKKAGTQI